MSNGNILWKKWNKYFLLECWSKYILLNVWFIFQNSSFSAPQHAAGITIVLQVCLGKGPNTHALAACNQYLPLAGASDLLHRQLQRYSMLSKHWGFAEVRPCQHSLTPVTHTKDCFKQHKWSENWHADVRSTTKRVKVITQVAVLLTVGINWTSLWYST